MPIGLKACNINISYKENGATIFATFHCKQVGFFQIPGWDILRWLYSLKNRYSGKLCLWHANAKSVGILVASFATGVMQSKKMKAKASRFIRNVGNMHNSPECTLSHHFDQRFQVLPYTSANLPGTYTTRTSHSLCTINSLVHIYYCYHFNKLAHVYYRFISVHWFTVP